MKKLPRLGVYECVGKIRVYEHPNRRQPAAGVGNFSFAIAAVTNGPLARGHPVNMHRAIDEAFFVRSDMETCNNTYQNV